MGKEWFIMKHSPVCPFWLRAIISVIFLTKSLFPGLQDLNTRINKEYPGYWYRKNRFREVIYITDDPYFRGFWKAEECCWEMPVLR